MRVGLGTLLLSALLVVTNGPVQAQTGEPIGSSILVVNRVTAELEREARTLQSGDDIRQMSLSKSAPTAEAS